MRTEIKKTFIDLDEEERWLNEQGAQGMMLLSYDNGTYGFEDVSPAEFQYKVDVPRYARKEERADYLDFLEQTGISVVAEYAGRVYLRKKASDGPFELYTSRRDVEWQSRRRRAHFWAIGFPQLTFGAYLLVQAVLGHGSDAAFWIPVAFGCLFAASGIVFLALGVKASRRGAKEQASGREDRMIWEE